MSFDLGPLGQEEVEIAVDYCGLCHSDLSILNDESKTVEAKSFGAHRVISSLNRKKILKAANSLDLLIATVNIPLDWAVLLKTLRTNGRLHVVGAVMEPIQVSVFDLLFGQKRISSSPGGSLDTLAKMLEFADRHHIAPQIERFPMSQINDAPTHPQLGKARYRMVLEADFV